MLLILRLITSFFVYFRKTHPELILWLLQLKQKREASNGNPEVAEELQKAISLAEQTYPGICDSLVAELVQRLQR